MQKISNIVVPVDFSEDSASALETALGYAEHFGARVRLVHVVPTSSLRLAVREGLLDADDSDEVVRRKTDEFVGAQFQEFLTQFGGAADAAERVILYGDPSHEIVCLASESASDLIVMGRRGETLADVVLGSVSERVIRHAPCPVLIVRRKGS